MLMPPWLTASIVALGLALAGLPLRAADLPAPELKISYAISGNALAENKGNADLWDRIRGGFRLPESNPDLVRAQERWFSGNAGH